MNKLKQKAERLRDAALAFQGYDGQLKLDFERTAKSFLREVATILGLPTVAPVVRYNRGGIAVSGEAVLHSDRVYVCVAASTMTGMGVYYRECQGQKDYSGGQNRWITYLELGADPHEFVRKLRALESQAVAS